MIDQHPLGYLLGVEGIALMRAFAGGHDRDFTERRLAEIRALLDAADRLGPGGSAAPISTMEGYAVWAPYYDHPGNELIDIEQPVVWDILDRVPGRVALDAACGTGRHSVHLAGLGYQVIGVDTSPDMLAIARDKVPGAQLHQADLRTLPLPDDHVDTVVCALALSHLPDVRAVLTEFARVLRPGGHLVISDSGGALGVGMPVVRQAADGRFGYMPHHVHRPAAYLGAAVPLGFQVRQFTELLQHGDLVDGRGVPTAFPDEDPPDAVGPYDTPPDFWTLNALAPEAVNAAYEGTPRAVIWHFQLG